VPKPPSKVLVIDASVARAAGTSENPISSATRRFLDSVLEVCHRMALTTPIREEWRRHQSKFAKRWRLAMYARKKIVVLQEVEDHALEARILDTGHTDEQRQAMLKDIPLIMAALQADYIVVSRDENARTLFQMEELNAITWVNPVFEPDRVREWLEQGAPAIEEWKLGHQA
jgi:hypothetical protein